MSERKANVLVLDAQSGTGRGSAMGGAYAEDPDVGHVYVAAGTGLIDMVTHGRVQAVPDVDPRNPAQVLRFCEEKGIDLVDIGAEVVLQHRLPNILRTSGYLVLGPNFESAQRSELNKNIARVDATEMGMPVPRYAYFSTKTAGKRHIKEKAEESSVIKALFLADGKGAVVARTRQTALRGIDFVCNLPHGVGRQYLIEELVGVNGGEEFSAYYLVGTPFFRSSEWQQEVIYLGDAGDEKPVDDQGLGPNTGGMGCFSPNGLLTPHVKDRNKKELVTPFLRGLRDKGVPYGPGVIYLGGMYEASTDNLWEIEKNNRWGDPEAEVVIPGIKTPFFSLSMIAIRGDLTSIKVETDGLVRVSVAAVSLGYPGNYDRVKNREIKGLLKVIKRHDGDPNFNVFGAGITMVDGVPRATGGRLVHFVAAAATLVKARRMVYGEIADLYISGDRPGESLLYFRNGIGMRELQRQVV